MRDIADQLGDVRRAHAASAETVRVLATELARVRDLCDGLIDNIEAEGYHIYAESLRRELAGGVR